MFCRWTQNSTIDRLVILYNLWQMLLVSLRYGSLTSPHAVLISHSLSMSLISYAYQPILSFFSWFFLSIWCKFSFYGSYFSPAAPISHTGQVEISLAVSHWVNHNSCGRLETSLGKTVMGLARWCSLLYMWLASTNCA